MNCPERGLDLHIMLWGVRFQSLMPFDSIDGFRSESPYLAGENAQLLENDVSESYWLTRSPAPHSGTRSAGCTSRRHSQSSGPWAPGRINPCPQAHPPLSRASIVGSGAVRHVALGQPAGHAWWQPGFVPRLA